MDYIVQHTVGKLLEGKTPEAGRRSSAILDPACGSGSFLIGAYQYLLDWHRDWYADNDPEQVGQGQPSRRSYQAGGGDWRLTTAERKRILLNNIYGVDIDPQAVEVTKLSLLLKVLEGETEQSLADQSSGSSTSAPCPTWATTSSAATRSSARTSTQQQQMTLLDDEERYRINVFDWQAEFPQVFRKKASIGELHETAAASPLDYTMPGVPLHGGYSYKKRKSEKVAPPPVEPEWEGGFDAVIGNPPYVRIQRISHVESDYLFRTYKSPTSKMDLSLVFLEKGLQVAAPTGRAGFICTSQWLAAGYGQNLRRMLADGRLHQVVDFGSLPVFTNASTYPAIFILSRKPAPALAVKRINNADQLNLRDVESAPIVTVELSSLTSAPWSLGGLDLTKILQRSNLTWRPLSNFGGAYIGCKTGLNEAFVLSSGAARELRLEELVLFPYALRGEEVCRYATVTPGAVVIYPYREGSDGTPQLLPEAELKQNCPRVHAHLLSFKDQLRQRQDSRCLYANGPQWYRHLRPGSFRYIRSPKLVFKAIAKTACGGLLGQDSAFDGANCPAIIVEGLGQHSIHYLLGSLNSRLLSYYLRGVCPPKLSGYLKFSATCLSGTPIRVINFSVAADKSRHDRLGALVEQMLALHTQLAASRTPQEQTALTRQIAATDTQIDRLVYDLYGLTEAELKIVEGTT